MVGLVDWGYFLFSLWKTPSPLIGLVARSLLEPLLWNSMSYFREIGLTSRNCMTLYNGLRSGGTSQADSRSRTGSLRDCRRLRWSLKTWRTSKPCHQPEERSSPTKSCGTLQLVWYPGRGGRSGWQIGTPFVSSSDGHHTMSTRLAAHAEEIQFSPQFRFLDESSHMKTSSF